MKRLSIATFSAVVLGLAIPSARAAGASGRQIEFAKKLALRQYYDLADIVLARVEADPDLIGIYKANVLRQLGQYYVEMAPRIAAQAGANYLERYIQAVGKANSYFRKFIAHRSPSSSERFEARLQLSRNSLAIAEAHLRRFRDPRTPDDQKAKHKAQALAIFKGAIDQSRAAIASKKKELDAKNKRKPKDPRDTQAHQKWQKEYNALRVDYFRVQIEHLNAEVRHAKLLKGLKAPASQWQAELKAAEKAYVHLLLEFVGEPGAIQANLYLGVCLLEQGPARDKDALTRFETVWQKRATFRNYKRIPCEAAYWMAVLYKRQKKYDKARDTLDDLLLFASDGVWNMDKVPRTIEKIEETLAELEGADRDQYTQKDAAQAFMLQAEVFAARAADKSTRPNIRKKLYAAAYAVAVGVGRVQGLRDPRYATLIEKWRRLGGGERDRVTVNALYIKALQERKYLRAAKLYTELVAMGAIERKDLRQAWFTIGQCYYAAKRYHQAAICFSAVSKWFPKPKSRAHEAALAAVGAQAQQLKATNSAFDKTLLARLRLDAESLDPIGPMRFTIDQAKKARSAGQYDKALRLLAQIKPANKAYAHALYETAITHKARFERLPDDRKRSIAGKAILSTMVAAFQKLLDHYRTAMPKLTGDENADARERLVGVAGAALVMLTDAYLRPYLNNPKQVIQLTDGLQKRYPGIGETRSAGPLYMKRMHAAYMLITQTQTAAEAARYLPIVEESWKAAKTQGDRFEYLDSAANIGAHASLAVAAKLEAEAKTADAGAKKDLEARALAARHRGIDLYIELLRAAPRQSLKTYRYVLYNLRKRARPADYQAIVELAPKAIQMYRAARDAATRKDRLYVTATLGVAYYGLGKYPEAIPYLASVESYYETAYQKARGQYEKDKERFERDPGAFRNRPPRLPRRNPEQPELKETLAYCYLAAKKADKYSWVLQAYNDLLRIYAKRPEKLRDIQYRIVETYRFMERYDDVIKLIQRFHMRDPSFGDPRTKSLFERLLEQTIRAIRKLEDPVEKNRLLPKAEELLKRLRKK